MTPEPCEIEIIERGPATDAELLVPNEIRINGRPVLAPAEDPVVVHEITVDSRDVVKVTLTLYARRVSMHHEPKPTPPQGD